MKVRGLIRTVVRSLAPRFGAATMAIVFLTMGGGGAMSVHSASHESHPGHIIAAGDSGGADHASHGRGDAHAAHHGGGTSDQNQQPDPATECTCVGPCQGGTAPSENRTTSHEVAEGEVHEVVVAPRAAGIVYRATAHILPLPTAPPSRV